MLSKLVLALVLAIQSTNPLLSTQTVRRYATWVAKEAEAHSLDPWLFPAIVRRETHWSTLEVRHESDGTCSVGLGQINGPCTRQAVLPMLDPHKNIRRMAEYLAHFRATCRTDCGDLGWLRAYNPGSPSYFEAVREAVHQYHAQAPQPAVRRVRPRLHTPGVLRPTDHRAGHERRLASRADHS